MCISLPGIRLTHPPLRRGKTQPYVDKGGVFFVLLGVVWDDACGLLVEFADLRGVLGVAGGRGAEDLLDVLEEGPP
jgi:hypothetical protein